MSKVKKGFTLAELLMAIWVMSIILAAVAALSFALGSANDSADNTSDIYSRIRYTTLRINELMRSSKLICANSGTSVAIWQADYNGDNKIEPNEIVYLETGGSSLKIVSFQPTPLAASQTLSLADVANGQARTWLNANCQVNSVTLINNCNSVSFSTDRGPPFTKQLKIFFSVNQDGIARNYQITDGVRCYADYLLDASGQIDPVDDDI
ncbi:MAG: prepilin-type N-terminal cleavage/methylation domain-containing protein [Phycisphaerae bacterium]|nr:prepilin-type N-terminal cleavage/methylation domain-containing protein [Phycisphaerae bacterium]